MKSLANYEEIPTNFSSIHMDLSFDESMKKINNGQEDYEWNFEKLISKKTLEATYESTLQLCTAPIEDEANIKISLKNMSEEDGSDEYITSLRSDAIQQELKIKNESHGNAIMNYAGMLVGQEDIRSQKTASTWYTMNSLNIGDIDQEILSVDSDHFLYKGEHLPMEGTIYVTDDGYDIQTYQTSGTNSGKYSISYTLSSEDHTCSVTESYSGYSQKTYFTKNSFVMTPDKKIYQITKINSFNKQQDLQFPEIPSTVTEFGENCFSGTSSSYIRNLGNMDASACSLTSIGTGAFNYTSGTLYLNPTTFEQLKNRFSLVENTQDQYYIDSTTMLIEIKS